MRSKIYAIIIQFAAQVSSMIQYTLPKKGPRPHSNPKNDAQNSVITKNKKKKYFNYHNIQAQDCAVADG